MIIIWCVFFLGSWTPFNPETVRLMIGNGVFQKISIPPHHRRDLKFQRSWEGGVSKPPKEGAGGTLGKKFLL